MSSSDPKENILTFPDLARIKTIVIWGTLATIAFVAIYGACNKWASESLNHYQMYMDWELSIPLLPWMIFPYISLNVLFVFCAFVLKSAESIKGFCVSIIFGALIAGLFFYFFPGKLGFERKLVQDFADIYNFMFSIDHPHNLFPSLHVTYSSLAIFAMKDQTRSKAFHFFLYGWLVSICLSVLMVHQHHVFDVVSGGALAALLYFKVYLRIAQASDISKPTF